MFDKLVIAREWRHAHKACGLTPDWTELQRVFKLYESKGRSYHTLRHVADTLRFMRATFGADGRHPVAIMALIYHDCIYDVTSKENEEKSADEFAYYATGVFPERFVRIGKELILATKSHKPVRDRMTQIVLDSDLHILAAPWPKYRKYAQGVWREFSVFGKEGYKKGRSAFLDGARTDIEFSSPEMKNRGSRMRQNMAMELAYLTNDPDVLLV